VDDESSTFGICRARLTSS